MPGMPVRPSAGGRIEQESQDMNSLLQRYEITHVPFGVLVVLIVGGGLIGGETPHAQLAERAAVSALTTIPTLQLAGATDHASEKLLGRFSR